VHLNKGWAMKKHPCITIMRHLTVHLPTCITFPNSSFVFLANMHFATLPPCIYAHCVSKNFIGILVNYATPTNGSWNVHCCINQLCNICIPTCFFPIQNFLRCEYCMCHVQHVVFDIISKWVLHFEVKGPSKVNLE
jgi:hypothetical protein